MANYKNVAGAAVFVACVSLCAGYEGLSTHAYHDTLARGLPTVCYGETEGVHMGDVYSPAECKKMLQDKLPRYWEEISKCIHVLISNNEKVAYTDFAYNVGSEGFCGSSLLKKLNEGDHKGACQGLMGWDHADGRQVSGLTRRRSAERAICLRADAQGIAKDVLSPPQEATHEQIIRHVKKAEAPKRAPVCSGFLMFRTCR